MYGMIRCKVAPPDELDISKLSVSVTLSQHPKFRYCLIICYSTGEFSPSVQPRFGFDLYSMDKRLVGVDTIASMGNTVWSIQYPAFCRHPEADNRLGGRSTSALGSTGTTTV